MFISASTCCPSPSVNRCYGISSLLPFEETIKYDGTCDFRFAAIPVYNSRRRPVGLNVLIVLEVTHGSITFYLIIHRCIIHELLSMSPAIFIATMMRSVPHGRKAGKTSRNNALRPKPFTTHRLEMIAPSSGGAWRSAGTVLYRAMHQ
jgi:hypothetical protein